jgi:hypothetical protein
MAHLEPSQTLQLASYRQPIIHDAVHDKVDELIKQEMQDFSQDGVSIRNLLPPAALPPPMNSSDLLLQGVLDNFVTSGDYLIDKNKWAHCDSSLHASSPQPDAEKKITDFFNMVGLHSYWVLPQLTFRR